MEWTMQTNWWGKRVWVFMAALADLHTSFWGRTPQLDVGPLSKFIWRFLVCFGLPNENSGLASKSHINFFGSAHLKRKSWVRHYMAGLNNIQAQLGPEVPGPRPADTQRLSSSPKEAILNWTRLLTHLAKMLVCVRESSYTFICGGHHTSHKWNLLSPEDLKARYPKKLWDV